MCTCRLNKDVIVPAQSGCVSGSAGALSVALPEGIEKPN